MVDKEVFEKTKDKTVFIFGAGMEIKGGIGLPSAADIPLKIWTALSDKGNEKAEKNIRAAAKTSYSYSALFLSQVNNIFCKSGICNKIIDRYSEENNKYVRFVCAFLQEVVNIGFDKTDGELQQRYDDLKQLIYPGENSKDFDLSHIVDIEKIAPSGESAEIIKTILEWYVKLEKKDESITEENRKELDSAQECIKELFQGIVDYDSLLTKSYIGFYSHVQTEQKKYFYLSWLLWLLLASVERKKVPEKTIYGKIKEALKDEDRIITMNYSTIVDRLFEKNKCGDEDSAPKVIHFHGDLAHYIFERKEYEINDYLEFDDDKDLQGILSPVLHAANLNVVSETQNNGKKEKRMELPIPSMMPPMDVKPLISNEYLERWVKAKNIIDDAERIIVVGYSFSEKDDHFNDMIFNANPKVKEIIIVRKDFSDEAQEELKNKFNDKIRDKVRTLNETSEVYFCYPESSD